MAALAFGWTTRAAAQAITEFSLPTTGASAYGIAAGPDGALWFTEYVLPTSSGNGPMPVSASKIGRITTSGVVAEYALPSAASAPQSIVAGPDGALWFAEAGFPTDYPLAPQSTPAKIGRITTDGSLTEFAIPFPSGTVPDVTAITAGPDGALWFTAGYINTGGVNIGTAVIGRITTEGTVTFFQLPSGGDPFGGIATGSDGALWFIAAYCCGVHGYGLDRLQTSGAGTVIHNFSVSTDGIAAGPDGALWISGGGALGRITTAGISTSFSVAADGGPNGIAAGPDGALWFASAVTVSFENNTSAIGRITTSGTNTAYPIPSSQNTVESVTAGPDGAMWFTEASGSGATGKIGRITVPASTSPLVAAVLPSSRSVQVGSTATAFATIINSGTSALTGCAIAPVTSVPASFLYQTTIASNNALAGTANTPVSIPAGGSQSFFFALTTNAPFVPTDTVLGFDCANTDAAVSVSGLNTILLSGSTTPVPDVIALSATTSGDGALHVPGSSGSGAFAVATADVGAGGQMSFTVDTGATALPLTLTVCPTDPTTARCLATPASSVPVTINAGATPTFSIFATATGSIPFAPQTNRIFARILDSGGTVRGATSVAVSTQ